MRLQMTEYRVQSTDESTEYRGAVSLQVDVVICHLYSAVSDNTKDKIVDVSDTACRVPTSELHLSPYNIPPPLRSSPYLRGTKWMGT